MIRIEKFLSGKKEQELFYSLGKRIEVKNGWVTMRNVSKKEEEALSILTDENQRIRCKGEEIAFSLQKEGDDLVIDHLQIKEKGQDYYKFSLRRKREGNKSIYRIRTTTDDRETIYWFKENEMSIIDSKDDVKKHYSFEKKGEQLKSNAKAEQKHDCWDCFLRLEKEYTMITAYINENISTILKDAIDYCNPYQMKAKDKIYQKTVKQAKLS